jgi:hypothetical protein
VRAGEGIDRGERISDPGEIRKRRGVDREEFCSFRLTRLADVGERDRVAVAIAAGGRLSGALRARSGLVEIFDDRQRLEQDRSFAVDQGGKRHHRVDRLALRALSTSSGTRPLRLSAIRTR